MTTLQDAIKYAKENPNTPFANELRKRIESGAFSNELQQMRQPQIEQSQSIIPESIRQAVTPPEFLKQVGVGALKGVGQTARQLGSVAPAIGAKLGELVTGKRTETFEPISKEMVTPQGTAQKIGYGAEKVAEFLIPAGEAQVIKKIADISKLLPRGLQTLTTTLGKSAIGAVSLGARAGLQEENVKSAATIGAVLPVAGLGMKLVGHLARGTGAKIQATNLRPMANDLADLYVPKGKTANQVFIENLNKYDLGGSINQTIAKSELLLNKLTNQLGVKLKGSKEFVDLNKIYLETAKKLSGEKATQFGEIGGIGRSLQELEKEIALVAGGEKAIVSVPTAQLVKRGAGTKGAWVFGNPNPDARATEKVYNTFYNILKTEIENRSPAGVKEINRQMSEIIPIIHIAMKRLPIAERNIPISLTDTITLAGSFIDPTTLALFAAGKASKSGRFGRLLYKGGEKFIKRPENIKTSVGAVMFGR